MQVGKMQGIIVINSKSVQICAEKLLNICQYEIYGKTIAKIRENVL